MNFGNNAYGIGQRRTVNNATSFAPIRSGGGGGGGGGIGIGNDDNFRGTQSMNYGRSDSFNNINNNTSYGNSNNNSSYGNNNNSNNGQRFTDIASKFGGMQSNNYSGFSNNQQRFGNTNNNRGAESLSVPPSKSNFNDNFRGQQQSSFMGRSTDQQRFDNSNRAINNTDYSTFHRGIDNFRGQSAAPLQQQQQQQQQQQGQLSNNLNLARSVSDLGYNDNNNQRFYNNDRNDTFRRADNFGDNFRGQESNNSNVGRTGANLKFNNERSVTESFGRSNNMSNSGYNNNNISNNNRSFDDNMRGNNQQSNNFDNNNKNKQQYFNNNKYNRNDDGFNPQNFRNQQNNGPMNNQAMAAINDTVNALMGNQSNWQVGNNNFGQGNFNPGGNRNNNIAKRNFNNAGPNQNPNPIMAQTGNWNNRPQQLPNQGQNRNQQSPNQGKVFKPPNNRPQAPVQSRKPSPAVLPKFQGNRAPNQPKPNTANNSNNAGPRPKPEQANKRNINISNNKQQTPNQTVVKNVNGGQKPQPKAAAVPPKTQNVAAQNTQTKPNVNPKPEVKKETPNANPKVGQKRAAPAPVAPPTKADIKRRKLALKRGFLLGGFKLPYINSNKVALPQPEDKSYAVMFFEQALIYSTSGEELDDETAATIEENDAEGKNAGRTLVKRIRKRLHFEWTQIEETKKYKSWQTWWTDYKWCEKAIQEQLDTFGSVSLRDCFIPDLPRLTTEQVVDVIVKQAQFGLEKNSDNYFNNMKSILTLMNVTFLENLKMPNSEKVQDMIRAVPNDFWAYKMRSMVYLWAQYLKISKTSSPATETGVKELQAIARDWKNPLFHWIAKQAFEELKAISEVEWPEHKQQYEELQSSEPTS